MGGSAKWETPRVSGTFPALDMYVESGGYLSELPLGRAGSAESSLR